jgi:hypothetical protein
MEESRSPTHLNGVTSCYCSHIIIRYGYVGEIMKNDRFVSTNSRKRGPFRIVLPDRFYEKGSLFFLIFLK